MDIDGVLTDLAAALTAIPGLRAVPYAADVIVPPAVVLMPPEITFDMTFGRGLDRYDIVAHLFAARSTDKTGQSALNGFLAGSGPSSVKAALIAVRRGSTEWRDLHVPRAHGYGQYEVANQSYWGALIDVQVFGQGA